MLRRADVKSVESVLQKGKKTTTGIQRKNSIRLASCEAESHKNKGKEKKKERAGHHLDQSGLYGVSFETGRWVGRRSGSRFQHAARERQCVRNCGCMRNCSANIQKYQRKEKAPCRERRKKQAQKGL